MQCHGVIEKPFRLESCHPVDHCDTERFIAAITCLRPRRHGYLGCFSLNVIPGTCSTDPAILLRHVDSHLVAEKLVIVVIDGMFILAT
jgi:hypothetical protein